MYVERWDDLHLVFWGAYSSMIKRDQEICIVFLEWIEDQGGRYAGIDPEIIEWYIRWIEPQRDQAGGLRRSDLTRSILFLRYLNYVRPADQCYTEAGCLTFNYYWYDNACHTDPKRIPAPPLPPPKPPPPEPEPPEPIVDDPGVIDFLADGVDLAVYYEKEAGLRIATRASKEVEKWHDILVGYEVWSDIIAAQEQLVKEVNNSFGLVEGWIEAFASLIGDITKLEGTNLIEMIEKGSGKLDEKTQAFIDYLLEPMGFMYNEEYKTVSYNTNAMWGNLKAIIQEWEDQGKSLGGLTKTDIDQILKDDYKLLTDTISLILSRLDYIERDIGIVTKEVTIEFEDLILDPIQPIENFLFATVAYVKKLVKTTAEKILDIVSEPMLDIIDNQNIIIRNVMDFSDPWIAALKTKLGDVGGEYDLEADPEFQLIRSEVNVIIDEVYEMSEGWVSILANRLQGYFDTGIGGKGEKGDPGLPGAQGIPGVPGVQGEKGEPGEGVGLAIEDIDSQLKERLVMGAAIVTNNVTGVIDYNITKIGEIFTRFDLEVKPITEFLTADMQDTLTMISESFDTPEALIAFLLDVPEGQEDVTYDLMQMLIAQIMERGLE